MSKIESHHAWLDPIEREPALAALDAAMLEGGVVRATGRCGFSTVLITALLHRRRPATRVLLVAHLDDADDATETLRSLGVDAVRFPAMERLPGDRSFRTDLLVDRIAVSDLLAEDRSRPRVIVAPVHALMQSLPTSESLDRGYRVYRVGDRCDREELVTFLIDGGYQRVTAIEEPGEFALRGDILDVFPRGSVPSRIDLDDDSIEAIWTIELDTMGSQERLERLDLLCERATDVVDGSGGHLIDRLGAGCEMVVDDLAEVTEQGRNYLYRLDDQQGILSVEDVFAAASDRLHCVATVVDASSGEAEDTIELPVGRNQPFAQDVREAVSDLLGW